jgi:ABC-2 type transport system ATP-binding protein
VIEGAGLTRSFGGRPAVVDVSLRVEPGEVVGLLGPNGAGKTTTIRLLLGLLRPHGGAVRLQRPVGYLPEVFPPYDALTVAGYLRFHCRVRSIQGGTSSPAIDEAMAAAGVADLAGRPVGRLSKGQRQRVGLAQAILGSPPSLILDEPTASLDPAQVVEARGLIRRTADAGAAVLVSTHLLAEAAAVCDRVVVLAGGRVLAEERPGDAADLEARFLRLVGGAGLT